MFTGWGGFCVACIIKNLTMPTGLEYTNSIIENDYHLQVCLRTLGRGSKDEEKRRYRYDAERNSVR